MGLHFSRLAIAVALALPLASSLYAAEQLDEFYTEIKGPDSKAAPLVVPQPKPVVESKMVQPQAPVVRKLSPGKTTTTVQSHTPIAYADVVAESEPAQYYGPVKATDTLWSIAERMRPGRAVSVHQTMLAIYRNNPSAFAGGRINGLNKGVRLVVPPVDKIKLESEAEAQQLLKSGSLRLSAKPAAMVGATTAKAPAQGKSRTVKLSPGSAPLVDSSSTQTVKPVVKLTPENPGVSAAASEEVKTPAVSSSTSTAAEQSVSAKSGDNGEVVSSKITIPSQPADAPQVDASVQKMVAEEGGTRVTTTVPAGYAQEMAALTESNKQLQEQVKQLSSQLDEIKSMLAAQAKGGQQVVASEAPATPAISTAVKVPSAEVIPAKPGAEAVPSSAAATEPESLVSHIFNPLNVGLFMGVSLLALAGLWLRLRAKNAQSVHNDDEVAESALLDESDSHFDHLMAADMVVLGDLPDLEQRDETLQPVPDVVLTERTEPSITLPGADDQEISLPDATSQIGSESAWANKPDPQLVPDESVEETVDLSEESEPEFTPRDSVTLTDEELMAQFGLSAEEEPAPAAEAIEPAEEAPLPDMPEAKAENTFQPRENINISNDELDALFNSVEEHDATEFIASDEEAEADSLVVESHPDAAALSGAEEAEQALREQLEKGEKSALAEAPAADWYQEEVVPSAPAAEAPAQFKGIDELLAEAEANLDKEEPYQGLSFDVGLDEFPEVMPGQEGVDVDADGGVGAKLDLARAYIEIDDKPSAIDLLNEVMEQGSGEQKSEAEKLLKRLS